MIKIIYDNKTVAEPSNIQSASILAKSYIQLMIEGKLPIKELSIDIHQINPTTLKRTHKRIIVRESLPQQLITQEVEIPQNELGLTNRIQ